MVETKDAHSEQEQRPHQDKLPINEWLLKRFTRHEVDLELPDSGQYRPVPFYDYARDAFQGADDEADAE